MSGQSAQTAWTKKTTFAQKFLMSVMARYSKTTGIISFLVFCCNILYLVVYIKYIMCRIDCIRKANKNLKKLFFTLSMISILWISIFVPLMITQTPQHENKTFGIIWIVVMNIAGYLIIPFILWRLSFQWPKTGLVLGIVSSSAACILFIKTSLRDLGFLK